MLPESQPELAALERVRRERWREHRTDAENLRAVVAAIAAVQDSEAMAQLLFWLHRYPDVVVRTPVWITGNRAAALTAIGVRTGYLFLVGGHVVLYAGGGYWRDRSEEFRFMAPVDSITALSWWTLLVPGVTIRLPGERHNLQFSPYKYQHLTADGRDFAIKDTTLTDVLVATAKIPLGLLAPGSEALVTVADYPTLHRDMTVAKRNKKLWRGLLGDAPAH